MGKAQARCRVPSVVPLAPRNLKKELAQSASSAREAFSQLGARGARASEAWSVDGSRESRDSAVAHSENAEAIRKGALRGDARSVPPDPSFAAQGDSDAPTLAELKAAIGYRQPAARALQVREERAERQQRARAEAAETERNRQLIREKLGSWTKDTAHRFERLQPPAEERALARKVGRDIWAINHMTNNGSGQDLAYALERMRTHAPTEAVGAWVVEAMGLVGELARRQLYSQKARRKLSRSFSLWVIGEDTRLRQIAGSLSRRAVRGVKRVPQSLLAKLAAVGGKPWSRATTTRDANESHAAGLFRRVRIPHALAHESERCGSSGQVVSRYWMELPRQPRQKRRTDMPTRVGALTGGDDPLSWVREQGKQAVVYALHAVALVSRRLSELASVPGLLCPLIHAPP